MTNSKNSQSRVEKIVKEIWDSLQQKEENAPQKICNRIKDDCDESVAHPNFKRNLECIIIRYEDILVNYLKKRFYEKIEDENNNPNILEKRRIITEENKNIADVSAIVQQGHRERSTTDEMNQLKHAYENTKIELIHRTILGIVLIMTAVLSGLEAFQNAFSNKNVLFDIVPFLVTFIGYLFCFFNQNSNFESKEPQEGTNQDTIYLCIYFLLMIFAYFTFAFAEKIYVAWLFISASIGYALCTFLEFYYIRNTLEQSKLEIEYKDQELFLIKTSTTICEQKAALKLRYHQQFLRRYAQQTLSQNIWMFCVGIVFIAIGFVLIIWTMRGNKGGDDITKIIKGISGLLSGYIGKTFIEMYSKTKTAVGDFYSKLVCMNQHLLGNLLCSKIENIQLRDETLAEMSKKLCYSCSDNLNGDSEKQSSKPDEQTSGDNPSEQSKEQNFKSDE